MHVRNWGALLCGLVTASCGQFEFIMAALVVFVLVCGRVGYHVKSVGTFKSSSRVPSGTASTAATPATPAAVLGVKLRQISEPLTLVGVQQQKRGDGNCYWRSCNSEAQHWRQLKKRTCSNFKSMRKHFVHFSDACDMCDDFVQGVQQASMKNQWVNRHMVFMHVAVEEVRLVLCEPGYSGTHCNSWTPTHVVEPQVSKSTVFVHYNGFHYNLLRIPRQSQRRFLAALSSTRSCEHASDRNLSPAHVLGTGGGRKKTPAPESAVHHSLGNFDAAWFDKFDNPLSVDSDASGSSFAIVNAHWARKPSMRFAGKTSCRIRHVREMVAQLTHNATGRIRVHDQNGVSLDDEDWCEVGQEAHVYISLSPPLATRRKRTSTKGGRCDKKRKHRCGSSSSERSLVLRHELMVASIAPSQQEKAVNGDIVFLKDPTCLSPTVKASSPVHSLGMTAAKPDGSQGGDAIDEDAGDEARLQLDKVADLVHRTEQVAALRGSLKRRGAKSECHASHESIFSNACVQHESAEDDIECALMVTHGTVHTALDVLVSDMDKPLLDIIAVNLVDPNKWLLIANGSIVDITTTPRTLVNAGVFHVLVISKFASYVSLTGCTRASFSHTWKCRNAGVHASLQNGTWGIVPRDGACFWHSLASAVSVPVWDLRDNILQEIRTFAPVLQQLVGGTVDSWHDLADHHWGDRTNWADAQIAMATAVILAREIWIWDPTAWATGCTCTRMGGLHTCGEPILLRCQHDHYMPWTGSFEFCIGSILDHDGFEVVGKPPALIGGGGDSQGWRSKSRNVVKDATEEQRDTGRAIGKVRAMGLELILQKKHWPMLLAVEPYLTVLLNTSSDVDKLRAEIITILLVHLYI
eukprot:4506792-Amphidinium_carterae.2